jgi:hypothetical protein
MSKIGTLTTGAGVVTTLTLQNIYQFILIGTVDAANALRALNVNLAGNDTINIIGASFVDAFTKLVTAGLLGADVTKARVIPIGDGSAGNVAAQYRLTNDGATTPDIFGFGTAKFENPVTAQMISVNSLSKQSFAGFSFLLVDTSNVSEVNATFGDGWQDRFDLADLAALTCLSENILDADGKLAGLTVIDGQLVEECTIYAGAGGSVSVCIVNIPFPVITD